MKKFSCSHCDKSFSRRDYLERHSANHLPVKPYVCGPCNRSFARSDLYENHLITKFHLKRALRSPSPVSSTSPSSSAAVQKPQIPGPSSPRRASVTTSGSTTPSIPPSNAPCTQPQAQAQPQPPATGQYSNPVTAFTTTKTTRASPPITPPQDNHAWLFDDTSEDWSAHYDVLYSRSCDVAQANATHAATNPVSWAMSIMVGGDRAAKVSKVLQMDLTPFKVSEYVDLCWTYSLCSPDVFIHRPTFYADSQRPELLAAMTLLGLYYNGQHEPMFDIMTQFGLVAHAVNTSDSRDAGVFQAFALLRWLQHQLKDATVPLDTRHMLKKFKYTRSPAADYRFNYTTDAEWERWVDYETRKRTIHFMVFSEFVYSAQELSVFDLDTDMPHPEPLWSANTANQFFISVGSSMSLQCTPYLYVLRSMLRLPKLGENPKDVNPSKVNYGNWSRISLGMVLYGFLDVAFRVSDNTGSLARLGRGLQIWRIYFEASTGVCQTPNFVKAATAKLDANAALLLKNYQAAHILLHEDLHLIKQAASILSTPSMKLDWDRFASWSKTVEAKELVAVSSLFLIQASKLNRSGAVFGPATFYAILIVWLYQCVTENDSEVPSNNNNNNNVEPPSTSHNDPIQYLSELWNRTNSGGAANEVTPPATPPTGTARLSLSSWPPQPSSSSNNNPVREPVSTVSSVLDLGDQVLRSISGSGIAYSQVLDRLRSVAVK